MKKLTRYMGMLLLVVIMLQLIVLPTKVKASQNFYPVYAHWMETLYNDIKDIPLYDLSIPGTHDSATYILDKNSWDGIDNGFADAIKIEQWPGLKDIIYNFSRTQEYNIYTQLKHGNRYLDIRLKRDSYNRIRGYHGMYGKTMQNIFEQIKRFVDENPREFVIVDLQHLHNLNAVDIQRLNHVIQEFIGNKLGSGNINSNSTVKQIMDSGTRVIILTQNTTLLSKSSKYWNRNNTVRSEWKNTSDINVLMDHLDFELGLRGFTKGLTMSNNNWARNRGYGYISQIPLHVSQMVCSPNLDEIIAPIKGGNIFKLPGIIGRWGSASIASLTVPHNERFANWLSSKGKGQINIAMRDFYDRDHIALTINRNLLP